MGAPHLNDRICQSHPLFVWKVPFEVPHNRAVALFMVGMHFWDPFFWWKGGHHSMLCRAVPLVPCWHRLMLLWSLFRCLLGLFRAFFFKFSHLLGLFNNFFGLAFRELFILSQKTFKHADNSSHFSGFSIAISVALIVSSASLVALIGRVSVESKWMPEGWSILRRLSTNFPVLLDPLS